MSDERFIETQRPSFKPHALAAHSGQYDSQHWALSGSEGDDVVGKLCLTTP
jgi:hypothetical protein